MTTPLDRYQLLADRRRQARRLADRRRQLRQMKSMKSTLLRSARQAAAEGRESEAQALRLQAVAIEVVPR